MKTNFIKKTKTSVPDELREMHPESHVMKMGISYGKDFPHDENIHGQISVYTAGEPPSACYEFLGTVESMDFNEGNHSELVNRAVEISLEKDSIVDMLYDWQINNIPCL